MPIYLIDKIKQKNNGTFKLVDSSDINWDDEGIVPDKNVADTLARKAWVSQEIANAGHLKREVVSAKPSNPDIHTIYMVPIADTTGAGENYYDEYMYINGKWEIIGNSKAILNDYITADDIYKKYPTRDEALLKTGGTMTGEIKGIPAKPSANDSAASKKYVDDTVNAYIPKGMLTVSDFATGNTSGTFKIGSTEIKIKDLGSAAYKNEDYFVKTSELVWNPVG